MVGRDERAETECGTTAGCVTCELSVVERRCVPVLLDCGSATVDIHSTAVIQATLGAATSISASRSAAAEDSAPASDSFSPTPTRCLSTPSVPMLTEAISHASTRVSYTDHMYGMAATHRHLHAVQQATTELVVPDATSRRTGMAGPASAAPRHGMPPTSRAARPPRSPTPPATRSTRSPPPAASCGCPASAARRTAALRV